MNKRYIYIVVFVLMGIIFIFGCDSKKKEQAKEEPDKKSQEILMAQNPSKIPDLAKERKDSLVIGINNLNGYFNPIYASTDNDYLVVSLL